MPWSASDASKHKDGLSPHQAEVWARVANEILERTGDEGRAIRGANAAVNRMREGGWSDEIDNLVTLTVSEAVAEAKMEESRW